MSWQNVEALLDQLIQEQQEKVVRCANEILPHLTEDDLLQPNDFPQLEHHPYFRYEEGVLAGLQTARMALLALGKELEGKALEF
jgi:hypothetical protein